MRLLRVDEQNNISLTPDLTEGVPRYAILSHTWGAEEDEVTFADLRDGPGRDKVGYKKILFCAKQAKKDGLEHFWVDTCCINKDSHSELSEAITSMFRWYQNAVKCYVYLADISNIVSPNVDLRHSRWFTRGWTLQELLAPKVVEFFSSEEHYLGNKASLISHIRDITGIPLTALDGASLSQFPVDERMRWAQNRSTKKAEDKAYCLLGIFDVFMPLIYGEGERAFHRLQKEIENDSGQVKSIHAHWIVPRATNPFFVGRQLLLEELEHLIRNAVHSPWNQATCQIVISGIGGQGKSELCLQLARRLRQMFWAVIWVDISTRDIAERDLLEAAEKLSINARNWKDACDGIANLTQPWLLIIDNADDPNIDYQDYFPEGKLGVVLMTTRNEECQRYGTDKAIALRELELSEAQQLLLKAARVPSDLHDTYLADALTVAKLLQSHALALVQAGTYVSHGHCSLGEYPNIFKKQRKRLLAFRPRQTRSRYGDVYTTFEVSVESLSTMNNEDAHDALELLPLLAICEANRFPLQVFEYGFRRAIAVPTTIADDEKDYKVRRLTPWHVKRMPSFCDTTSQSWDSYRLLEALNLLKAFSLCSTDREGGVEFVSLHPLIHAWARDRLEHAQQLSAWKSMGCIMALAVSNLTIYSSEQMRRMQPHVEALLEWNVSELLANDTATPVARILVICSRYLERQGVRSKASACMLKCLDDLGLDRSNVDPAWFGIYELISWDPSATGGSTDALRLCEALAQIQAETLKEDDHQRLLSEYNLGEAYRIDGQAQKAINVLEKVVQIQTRTLRNDDLAFLDSQSALARAYFDNDQVTKAIDLLRTVVKVQEKLAEDDPDRRIAQYELARAYSKNGQLKEAIELLREVYLVEREVLPEDHGDRLLTEIHLAIYYRDFGNVEEAIKIQTHLVQVYKRSLGDYDRTRIWAEHRLAEDLWKAKRKEEAIDTMTQVVELRTQAFEEEDSDRLASDYRLSKWLWDVGRDEQAVTALRRVVEIRQRTQSSDNFERRQSEFYFADMLWKSDSREEALALMISLYDIEKQILNRDDHALIATEKKLVHYLQDLGEEEQALAILLGKSELEEKQK